MKNVFDQQQAILKFLGLADRKGLTKVTLIIDADSISLTIEEITGKLDETVTSNFKLEPL